MLMSKRTLLVGGTVVTFIIGNDIGLMALLDREAAGLPARWKLLEPHEIRDST